MVEPVGKRVRNSDALASAVAKGTKFVPLEDRYRVVVFGRPRGPWREKKERAVQDAIDQGLAAYDRSRREHFIAVPTDIEWRRNP